MSVDSHERATTLRLDTSVEPRIKKERGDVSPDDAAAGAASSRIDDVARHSNGFHAGDHLQNILVTKFAALAHQSPAAKFEKIRLVIEDGISEESRSRVQEIFTQVEQLKIEEKLLLYLKLPMSLTSLSGAMDPLRQPLNPLGNRYEIHQTIMWIKTHLEEDPEISLPKQEVYDEYNLFCTKNSMKPLSTADFGKVMKQVYPRVRPRRLGTRGNSRYCYAGMRKRIKLDPPTLPSINNAESDDEAEENASEEMLCAASTLIREWAESSLGLKFPSLCALSRYLVDKHFVDNGSLAAVCVLCPSSENKETSPCAAAGGKQAGKVREIQLQLQRKLQQKEQIRDQKNRNTDTALQGKEKIADNKGASSGSKGGRKSKAAHSPQGTNTPTAQTTSSKVNSVANPVGSRQKKVAKSNNQSCNVSPQSNCDNLVVQSSDNVQNNSAPRVASANCTTLPKEAKSKTARKRGVTNVAQQQGQTSGSSPEKQAKLADTPSLDKNSSTVDNSKFIKSKTNNKLAAAQALKSCNKDLIVCPNNNYPKTNGGPDEKHVLSKDQIRLLQENSNTLAKNSIESDAFDDYLNGGNNSQEQEEELLQYFQQSNSSSSDVEASGVVFEAEPVSRSDKVSQLRLILQENLKEVPVENTVLITSTQPVETQQETVQKPETVLPSLLMNHGSQASSGSRRRVSFETNVMTHSQDAATSCVANIVPQSPNTRRRIFNFTPISPSPHSPINGRASKPSSGTASPFVSPRNTPVPRSRSNIQASGCRSRSTQKTLSRSISCSVPYIGKPADSFIVPSSTGQEISKQQLASVTKSSEVQVDVPSQSLPVVPKTEQEVTLFSSDLAPQKQLLINYPSQENLQEIKNVYQKALPMDREISELLHGDKQFSREQMFYRSQSVPLHRMVNPTFLMSPSPYPPHFQSPNFNPSTGSSIAPTPVPSEFNDFGNDYLLDDVDQQFLIGDKEISPENINNILNILEKDDQISPEDEEPLLIPMNIGSQRAMDPTAVLEPPLHSGISKIIHSRSYPNTPQPLPGTTAFALGGYVEDGNGSRSYPSTPQHIAQQPHDYSESNEPMLSSPTLNTLNIHGESGNGTTDQGAYCVADLLESDNIFGEPDGENGDLDPLGHFEGLQDVDSLAPLFTEVVEPNR